MKKELEKRTKQFALQVINLINQLPPNRVSSVLAHQVLKNGTSIGANYREANRAQSKEDFIHKLAICEKEAAETEYWFELISEAKLAEAELVNSVINETRQLLAIFVASGRTAEKRRQN